MRVLLEAYPVWLLPPGVCKGVWPWAPAGAEGSDLPSLTSDFGWKRHYCPRAAPGLEASLVQAYSVCFLFYFHLKIIVVQSSRRCSLKKFKFACLDAISRGICPWASADAGGFGHTCHFPSWLGLEPWLNDSLMFIDCNRRPWLPSRKKNEQRYKQRIGW